jgi:hypothetical protein
MQNPYKYYKRKFKNKLEPILVMLMAKKASHYDWTAHVQETFDHIINNPKEFLGDDLPEKKITNDILQQIIEQFLTSRKTPAQKSNI